jgi:tRNA U55 pseudouridine synthase TruB
LISEFYAKEGTYIRSLAFDFGHAMNSGSHLTALRRTKIEIMMWKKL